VKPAEKVANPVLAISTRWCWPGEGKLCQPDECRFTRVKTQHRRQRKVRASVEGRAGAQCRDRMASLSANITEQPIHDLSAGFSEMLRPDFDRGQAVSDLSEDNTGAESKQKRMYLVRTGCCVGNEALAQSGVMYTGRV
jgi:hypothetical protein